MLWMKHANIDNVNLQVLYAFFAQIMTTRLQRIILSKYAKSSWEFSLSKLKEPSIKYERKTLQAEI